MDLSIVVAASQNGVIGRDGDLPWHISEDLKRFKRLTMGNTLIMGRKTFESIGRCLPGRTTVIISRNPEFGFDGTLIANDFQSALAVVPENTHPFVVGGGQIYELAMPHSNKVHLTRVLVELDGDAFFPLEQLEKGWQLDEKDGPHFCDKENLEYQFETYSRTV